MKRIPIFVTFLVGLAVATMLGLGIWQLQRAQWKNELLQSYAAAQDQDEIAYPSVPIPGDPPIFYRSSVNCMEVTGWRSASGRNVDGQSGWAHIASCRTGGGEGPGAQVVLGWSKSPDDPDWKGGIIDGVIAPDSQYIIRLIATNPPGELQQIQPPSIDDIPNNHMAYAVQWFLFAGIALIIFIIALRARNRKAPEAREAS